MIVKASQTKNIGPRTGNTQRMLKNRSNPMPFNLFAARLTQTHDGSSYMLINVNIKRFYIQEIIYKLSIMYNFNCIQLLEKYELSSL